VCKNIVLADVQTAEIEKHMAPLNLWQPTCHFFLKETHEPFGSDADPMAS
jgi:hypothetical protein